MTENYLFGSDEDFRRMETKKCLYALRIIGVCGLVALVSLFSEPLISSATWPWVPGYVERAKTEHTKVSSLDVRVRYTVANESYVCRTLSWGDESLPVEIHAGAITNVYYDPAKPCRCVLKPGVTPDVVMALCVGLAFLGGGLWAHLKLRRFKHLSVTPANTTGLW